jgi:hypothetical protein
MMIRDEQVIRYMQLRATGTTQAQAAIKRGMHVKTARHYERAGKLPSELKTPRTWVTRPNPFAEDWPWVVAQLERDPPLQATTWFQDLCQRTPGRYRPPHVRTLQRHVAHMWRTCGAHVAQWRAQHGPEREAIFAQVHVPGERMQTDCTHMDNLEVTINGVAFPPLLYHRVLTSSNVEAVRVCCGETCEALAEGIEAALWQCGGVPAQHRTDHVGATIHPLPRDEQEAFKARYAALMRHYGMHPTLHNTGVAQENGDVEQSHHQCKRLVDQALRLRGSRDFASRALDERFLNDLVRRRHETRHRRWAEEQQHWHPLPTRRLEPCRELHLTVSRFSTIAVRGNTYSVPSRLIGTSVLVRIRAEGIEGYVGSQKTVELPRLVGKGAAAIDYRHLIWSVVRKPGAFAQYPYRDAFFPTRAFRQCYDQLQHDLPARADTDYLHSLHLAATPSEAEVQTALDLLRDGGQTPTFDQVRALVQPTPVPALPPITVNLRPYDALLGVGHG